MMAIVVDRIFVWLLQDWLAARAVPQNTKKLSQTVKYLREDGLKFRFILAANSTA